MMIQLEHISKKYDDMLILEDITMRVQAGMIHGIIGYNGAGKSTIAKIIGGMCEMDGGEMYLDGSRLKKWDVSTALRNGVYLVDNHSTLLPELTVLENMLYGLNGMMPGKKAPIITARRRVEKQLGRMIQALGLDCRPNQLVRELTNSLRNVLELVRVVMFSPKFVMIDEIDTSVNENDKEIIRQLILWMKSEGVGIVYISHQIEYVISLADEISIIMNKHVVETVRTADKNPGSMLEVLFRSVRDKPPKTIVEAQAVIMELRRVNTGVLKDFSLKVKEGEIVGVIGLDKQGPGSFDGLLFFGNYHGNGRILVREQEIRMSTPWEAMRAGIVFLDANVLENYLFYGCTVWENMLPFSIKVSHKSEEQRIEICESYLKKLHIETSATEIIDKVSTGVQKKILLARHILADGELYIFNNPTDNIDTISKIDIYNIINELKSRGNGIIFVSNDYREIAGISDRIIVVQNGRVVRDFENRTNDEKEIFEGM